MLIHSDFIHNYRNSRNSISKIKLFGVGGIVILKELGTY